MTARDNRRRKARVQRCRCGAKALLTGDAFGKGIYWCDGCGEWFAVPDTET